MARRKREPGGYALGSTASFEVAMRVRSLLIERGMTQYTLSKATGIPTSHLSDLLQEDEKAPRRRRMQSWHVEAIAKALSATEQSLIEGVRVGPATDRNPETPRSGSDPSATVPRAVAELLWERGKSDGVSREDRDELLSAHYLHAAGVPRGVEYYRGVLDAIQRASQGTTSGGSRR